MLVWINGPFGGGKTATAYELRRRLPGSALCDPEHVGFGMLRMLPAALRANFQDLPAWRCSVTELPRLPLPADAGPVIVPMTLADHGYFQEIIGSLRGDGFAVHHQLSDSLQRLHAPECHHHPQHPVRLMRPGGSTGYPRGGQSSPVSWSG